MKKLAMLLFVLALCVPVRSNASSISIDLGTARSFGAGEKIFAAGAPSQARWRATSGEERRYCSPSACC